MFQTICSNNDNHSTSFESYSYETTDCLKSNNEYSTWTFESLYKKYQSQVFHFAMKKLQNRDDAEEVLNDVMLDVWRKLSEFQGRSKLSTWILGITHHKSIDLIRKRARHEHHPSYEKDTASLKESSSDDNLAALQQQNYVRQKVEQLPEKYKEVINLSFYSDHNYADIASILSIPVGTVKTRMMNGKKILKKKLLH